MNTVPEYKLKELIAPFIASVAEGKTEIYNEFSLQHELGVFLRRNLVGAKVQFERNVSFFFQSKANFTKRELDISVFSNDKSNLILAIELKYPRNGQHPEQMFSFCKDIAFTEELVISGFSGAVLIIFADDPLFYRGSTEGIYGFFRGGRALHGHIQKPTGKKDDEVIIRGSYFVDWEPIFGTLKYSIIEVNPLV